MKAMFTCRYADIARVGKISAENETTSELSEFQTQIKHECSVYRSECKHRSNMNAVSTGQSANTYQT